MRGWLRTTILAIVVAFAMTLAACTAGSEPAPTDEPSPSRSPSPTSNPLAPDGAGATAQAPPLSRLLGAGYSYALPEGWRDLTTAVIDNETPAADSVSGSSDLLQSASALLIVRPSPVDKTGDLAADRAALRATLRRSFTTQLDGPIQNKPVRKIGGAKALGLQVRLAVRDDVSISATYFVVRRGAISYQLEAVIRDDKAVNAQSFKEIFESWSWDA